MIYFVTGNLELFDNEHYKVITVQQSLDIMRDWKVVQYDSETDGVDCHINSLLSMQFGNEAANTQIVVDAQTVDVRQYKEILETKVIIGFNLKFDLEFLYNYEIIPRLVYDAMIVEQLLYLGWGHNMTYNLKDVAKRRLGINIDKSIRGNIIWMGLCTETILYGAGDVTYLEAIKRSQIEDLRKQGMMIGAKLECDAVPAMAYLEWCGIKLDEKKWLAKMEQDKINLNDALTALNDYVMQKESCKKWVKINTQGDLFLGFDTTPHWTVDWQKKEAIKVIQALGFDTKAISKTTGEETDSVLEKNLKVQKGIDDEFLDLYFKYQEYYKVTTSFGQGHLNAINPITGRLHTTFKQIGASSGRMSCGSQKENVDLAKYKKIPSSQCTYPNIQQLPANDETRSCFVAEEGNSFCSCDFSALESRLGADIYNEKSMIDEFLYGSGDMHSLCAYMIYKDEIPRDTNIKDIKKLFPKLRKDVKSIEFSQQFGGSEFSIMGSMGCSIEEARAFKEAYDKGFPGITAFKQKGSKFVRQNGYVLICQETGHKMYWWDWEKWKEEQESFTEQFWEEYRQFHKGTNDEIAQMVSRHFKVASKWDRMALNGPTQGTGACILKDAATALFNWVIDNNLFGKVKFCAFVHDEICVEFPKEMDFFPKMLEKLMQDSAAKYCKALPIPAEASVGSYWIH